MKLRTLRLCAAAGAMLLCLSATASCTGKPKQPDTGTTETTAEQNARMTLIRDGESVGWSIRSGQVRAWEMR